MQFCGSNWNTREQMGFRVRLDYAGRLNPCRPFALTSRSFDLHHVIADFDVSGKLSTGARLCQPTLHDWFRKLPKVKD